MSCKLMDIFYKKSYTFASFNLYQARTGLCATVPWHMGPYWDIKWALDNCLISVFVNIQRCLKQTIRQYGTKIKGTGLE